MLSYFQSCVSACIILYDNECWPLTKTVGNRFLKLERKIFQKTFGPVRESSGWIILLNHEIYRKFEKPNVAGVIKFICIRWLGHILRCDN